MNKSIADRFFSKVERIAGVDCWIWIGGTIPDGYGVLNAPSFGTTLAHRISWMLHKGQLKKEQQILHRCDVPACVNPDHLFIGSPSENMRDMANKRRHIFCKLTADDVLFIREQRGRGVTLSSIAQLLGVSEATVSRTARFLIWKATA